jgi:ApbE superfamily uncharacterized protein (UPF0280 family)
MNQDRFRFFPVTLQESDLLIGVPHDQYQPSMPEIGLNEVSRIRQILDKHMAKNPLFGSSLEALSLPRKDSETPEELVTMLSCGLKTQTGPMSAVAGLFAERVGWRLVNEYELEEVVVENGGDLYLKNSTQLISVIHAGTSPLSDKMAFVIPQGAWGICTSSGTMGHSFSLGKADSVTVIAKSTPLADSWATALANEVKSAVDMESILDRCNSISDILGCAIIVDGQIGIRGAFEVKLLS